MPGMDWSSFIAVMFAYSVPLTLIVLVSLPLYVALSLVLVPILRARLNEKFARGAENQALLVETVTGIQTVKAGALEPSLARRWDEQLAAYVSASFKTSTLASYGHEGINLIGKVVGAATLWYGARLVMEKELSVGQFVAFNMFAQRVAQPVMRMAQLWTDFQQTGISMARLGDILFRIEEHAAGSQDYAVDHSASIFLTDPQGRLHGVFPAPHDADAMTRDLAHVFSPPELSSR